PHAAHDSHHDEIARLTVMQSVGVGEIVHQSIESASKADKETGEGKGDPNGKVDRNAQKACPAFVFTDRHHRAAKGRVENEAHHGSGESETRRHEAKRQWLSRKAPQAVVASGERVPLESDVVEDLAKRDCDHCEVNAAPAH